MILFLMLSGALLANMPAASLRDDPEVHPAAGPTDLRIVDRAELILSSPSHWDRRDTRQCLPSTARVSLYCALERAADEVAGKFEHRSAVMQEARFALETLKPGAKNYEHRLMDFNNDPRTRFSDVRAVLRLTRIRIENDLARQRAAVHREDLSR